MKQAPSRILNEPSSVMGLTGTDILALAIVFMLAQRVLYAFGLEILALLIALVAGAFLSIIRMKYRRKIVRDSLFYFYSKWLLAGFIYVRTVNRPAKTK